MKEIFKKGLKICLGIFILIVAFSCGFLVYEKYNEAAREQQELNFHSNKEWKWHNKYENVQIAYDDWRNQTLFRKVMLHDNYEVIVAMFPDHSLDATVKFYTKCEPSKVINTDQKFSDGSVKKLRCNKAGDAIRYRVRIERDMSKRYAMIVWKDNLGGFAVDIDMSFWDFGPLDREVTLMDEKPWEISRRMELIE